MTKFIVAPFPFLRVRGFVLRQVARLRRIGILKGNTRLRRIGRGGVKRFHGIGARYTLRQIQRRGDLELPVTELLKTFGIAAESRFLAAI